MVKYRATVLGEIEAVEVLWETERAVAFPEKDSMGYNFYALKQGKAAHYFDTLEEATKWVGEQTEADILKYEQFLASRRELFAKAKAMKKG